ncbi:TIGR01620 family protein [Shewanella sp. ULN5]|uniref:TIGR01620 family protein n=1 Tax=Shewanella sp. ULN5 TaxID=2994678 RepID=UPI00273DDA0F|nr:TIGR01620 family protein [Shewanella sp. ULN5]MDP5148048.1 TIGR01620 family protein [Shewanella sp. ULN5]
MKNNNIKPAQVFSEQQTVDAKTDDAVSTVQPPLKPAQSFNEADFIDELALATDKTADDLQSLMPESVLDEVLKESKQPKRWSLLAKLSLISVGLLIIVQTVTGLLTAFEQSPYLFGFYAFVLGVLITWLSVIVIKEWRKLVALKQVGVNQDTATRLADSMQIGEAGPYIESLLLHYPDNQAKHAYLSQVSVEHNDAEKVMLFDDLVLSERDELAKKYVSRFSAESALLLAASPLAALDMALILWRNQAMISKIAKVYGIELGYWSRIKLIRSIIVNIIYAGTAEVATDLGTQLLSVEMTGKLSARVAQGLGGGLLTARLGYQAMALCRPIKFNKKNKPKLSKIHQHLLSEIKGLTADAINQSKVLKATDEKQKVQ